MIKWGFYIFVSILAISSSLFADGDGQFKLEAAFIYQFTNFIEWNDKAKESSPFVISVIGSSPLVQELEELAKTKTVQGRPLKIYEIQDAAKLTKSNIVMITPSDESILQVVIEKTKGSSTLIISKAEGFAKKGAAINFFEEAGRLRFEINRANLEAHKLQASSRLLNLAKLVE